MIPELHIQEKTFMEITSIGWKYKNENLDFIFCDP
jgi:hypothetical protein